MEPRTTTSAQRPALSGLADLVCRHLPSGGQPTAELGMGLCALLTASEALGDPRHLAVVKERADALVGALLNTVGSEQTLSPGSPAVGLALLRLRSLCGEDRYREAAGRLVDCVDRRAHLGASGYRQQIRLEALYPFAPFHAAYAREQGVAEPFDEVCDLLVFTEERMRDVRTGLLHHAWDASRKQLWADPRTGCSPHFWARGMGLFGMAVVEVLDHLPVDHAERPTVLAVLRRFADAVQGVQDRRSRLWYQIMDHPGRSRNYTETSASAMCAYVLARGARQGHLDRRCLTAAEAAYEALVADRLVADDAGAFHLEGISPDMELGGNPYRDGTYDGYVRGATCTDHMLGLAPLLLAGIEVRREGAPPPS